MTVGPVLRYLLCNLLLLSGVTSVNVSANDVYTDGSVFTHDVDGTQLTLKILSIADRTIQVGDGKAPAIPTETSASLAIPPTIMLDGSTYKIVNIGTSAFSGCTGITDVVIPDGVQMIRSKTFYGCTALKSVAIPNSVYRLGNSSFYGCTALESIELPVGLIGVDGYPGVGDNAFLKCELRTL